MTDRCYRPRCRSAPEFNVDQMAWRSESCVRHLGELVDRRTAGDLASFAVTVTRISKEAPAEAQEPR